MKLSILFSVFIAIIAISFAFQNNDPVSVTFFSSQIDASVALVILASLVLGFLIGFTLLIPNVLSSSWRISRQNKEIKKLQDKVESEGMKFDAEGLGEEGETRTRGGL